MVPRRSLSGDWITDHYGEKAPHAATRESLPQLRQAIAKWDLSTVPWSTPPGRESTSIKQQRRPLISELVLQSIRIHSRSASLPSRLPGNLPTTRSSWLLQSKLCFLCSLHPGTISTPLFHFPLSISIISNKVDKVLCLLISSSAIAIPVVGTTPGEPKPTKGLGFPSVFPTGGHPKPTLAARAPSGGFSHPGYSKPSNESSHKPSGTGTKPSFTPYKLFL